ncbi:MAG: hypothetical protein SAMD01599839_14380 [Rectinema sp.]
MIPIGDDNSGRRGKPVVTWILIGLNILVFVFLQKFALDDYATLALAAISGVLAAYFAHIGGFLSAYIWARVYKRKELEHIHKWRRRNPSGASDGFNWWIVDDN